MLSLRSGRVVDILTDRAKFHALRHRGTTADAPHRALYKLVDVLYRLRDTDGSPKTGWTEHDYVFSGYTLADIHSATDWSDAEKNELFTWVAQRSQRLIIETCRRRLVDKQHQLSTLFYTAPEFLYSKLRQAISALSLQRASASQWLATVTNMPGIRQEEIDWSGLRDATKSDSIISKQQLLDSIDFGVIKPSLSTEIIHGEECDLDFREVVIRMPHQAVYRAALKLDATCQCILRFQNEKHNYRVGVVKTLQKNHHMSLNRYWFALDPYGRAICNPDNRGLYFSDSDAARLAARQHARQQMGIHGCPRMHTRFDHISLYGGRDYREWLVSLIDYPRIFFGAHHFDHNVLVHIRTTTRHDMQGRKLLFIEELQSDWHQSGQQHGYNNSCWGKIAHAPFKKEWTTLAVKLMLIHASLHGFDGIAWPDGKIQETRYSRVLPTIRRRYDRDIPCVLNRMGRKFSNLVERGSIKTRDPWLNLVKTKNRWRVSDGTGKFETRDKYHSREEAMQVLHRHCRSIELEVSVFIITEAMHRHIREYGLPLFGESLE